VREIRRNKSGLLTTPPLIPNIFHWKKMSTKNSYKRGFLAKITNKRKKTEFLAICHPAPWCAKRTTQDTNYERLFTSHRLC
jgi:hypothetical protein